MTNTKKPKVNDKSSIGKESQPIDKQRSIMTKTELEHAYKLGLMRDCQIYGKSYPESKAYFKSKGFTLGHSQNTELKKELKSRQTAKDWFSKEALYVIEEDHMVSVERIRLVEDKIVTQLLKLIKDDDFETTISYDKYENVVKIRNYNLELLDKLTVRFESLQETKTKMFSATPLVQEMMEVHEQQQNESQITIPTKKEKEITNV